MIGHRILVVDDEPQIQRFLKPALLAVDFDVIAAGTAREALRLAAARAPDLIVLDLGLPDADGKSVIRDIRGFSAVPIIVLSARGAEREKVEALDLGADDYVEKPFGIAELLARIRTLLRRREPLTQGEGVVSFGACRLDVERRQLLREGAPVHLTPKEYDLLVLLLGHRGRVMTHRQLLAGVWGAAHSGDVQYLRVAVAQLRAKLEPDPAHPRFVVNEPAIGYRFTDET